MSAWNHYPDQTALLAFLRLTTAERGAIVARMGITERCAWELAYARVEGRGVTRAREAFDGWVSAYADGLQMEVGRT